MILLTEYNNNLEVLTEQTAAGKVMYLEGPMVQTELKNRNGRIYPKGLMEKAVDKYNKEYVLERRACGELNHPAYPFPDPKKAAILIESLTWHGNNVIGKARVLDTPDGQIIKALMEANFKMGVSTRGLGEVKDRRDAKYVEQYLMTAIDAVDNPSGQVCYMNAMNESVDWIQENGIWVESANREKTKELFLEKFEQLINKIKGI